MAYTRFELRMEFLIKRKDGDWFDLHRDQFDETLRPSSYLSKRVSGVGDHRIEFDGCEVLFSYEEPGILVSFECRTSPRTRRR